jgi:hypothetical protein
MEIKTVEEVEALKKSAQGRNHGEIAFAKEVEQLKPGEGFIIRTDDWTRKTPIAGYFSGKFNRKGVKVVRTTKLNEDEVLITKR